MGVRTRRAALALRAAGAVAALGALASCSSSTPAPTVTVTRTLPPSAPVTSAPATPVPSSSTTAAPTHLTKLPGRCGSLLPLASVNNAVNRNLKGKTAFVVGVPEKDIKRLGYINCRYGVRPGHPTPTVEIGVSLYRTSAAARARIRPTVSDYVDNHGARDSTTRVDGLPAHVLTGGSGAGYTAATLVLADGQRTVAVSVADPIPPSGRTKALTALATLADKRTGR